MDKKSNKSKPKYCPKCNKMLLKYEEDSEGEITIYYKCRNCDADIMAKFIRQTIVVLTVLSILILILISLNIVVYNKVKVDSYVTEDKD